MVRILILVVSLLILLGGAVGGLYYWGIDPLAKLGLKPGELKDQAKAAASAAAAAAVKVPPSYVDFGLLVVPVVQNHEVHAQAEIVIRLQVPAGKVEHIALYLPRLQAAYEESMMEFIPGLLRDRGSLDIDPLRDRLLLVSNQVFPNEILDVIIENALLHQL
jgi:hypothetical protein